MKYSLFFVEDEIGIRDKIKSSINWDETDFIYSGDASDGETALAYIIRHQPDILITDIKMPFMDGLELSRTVKKILPETQIILLSGYGDFEYAQAAIGLGVVEYLLKPVTPAKLLQVLSSVAIKIREERKKSEYINTLKSEISSTMPVLVENFLFSLVSGEVNPLDVYKKAEECCNDIYAPFYCATVIYSDKYIDKISFKSVLGEKVPCDLTFRKSYHEIGIILKDETEAQLNVSMKDMAQAVIENFNEQYGGIFIGIGNVVPRLTAVSESYKNACSCIDIREELEDGVNFIAYQEIKDKRKKQSPVFIAPLDKKVLLEFLKTGLASDVDSFLAEYLGQINFSKQSVHYLFYILMDICATAREFVSSFEYDPESIPQLFPDIDTVRQMENLSDFVRKMLLTVLDLRGKSINDKFRNTITLVKGYINDNYSRHDNLLMDISKKVCISPGYLNTIFKKQMGYTIAEYITDVRIMRAKEILRTTSLRTSQVGESVGYNEPNYFSTIFKKHTGMTPKEYRNRL